MPISSQALGKSKEGSETKDTKVSLQRPTSQVDDDIVQSSWKHEKYKGSDSTYLHINRTITN
jgi:hypothetical protein